jgi:hypothetical protein
VWFDADILDFQIYFLLWYFGFFGLAINLAGFNKIGQLFYQSSGHPGGYKHSCK